jgi:dTDP-4-dehydrorhamnose 3,5-epimerase-like enzyme
MQYNKRKENPMKIEKIIFEEHGDSRGQLIAIEENKDIPFEVKRIYYMYDTAENVSRGHHAHKKLQQILICVHGSCEVLLDDGNERQRIRLDKPYEGIYLSNAIWREMDNFSKDAVLLVMASDFYIEEDYIRDYDEFLQFIGKK